MKRSHIKSLCYQTELDILSFDALIDERDEYIRIESPSSPSFFWGNFLLFPQPPAAGDLERWRELFRREFGAERMERHVTFGWDTTSGELGDVEDFVEAGFDIERLVTLSLRDADAIVQPVNCNQQVQVRALETDDDWEQALENQVDCREDGHSEDAYRTFAIDQMARRRAMVDEGLGRWFGAFLYGDLVADCGLFVFADGRARYQSVGTHPDYRRRGIAGRLIHDVTRIGFDEMGTTTQVIVADTEYHAARIYESIGFRPTDYGVGASWWQRTE